MLHTIEKKDVDKYRCEVCGESAVFIDDGKTITTNKGEAIPIGTKKGMVYATCDHCKKIVCADPSIRAKKSPIVRRFSLEGHYKDSKCCMQESIYIDHMGNYKLITCCRDEACVRHFEDDLRQKRNKTLQIGGIKEND